MVKDFKINGIDKSLLEPQKAIRPPLKWAGGKRWLIPHMKPLWETHKGKRYVEPMCGGIAVSLGLLPKKAMLNDINPHAINFFRWLKKGLRISISMQNDKKLFYKHRERFNKLTSNGRSESKEAAELFYYLNRTCYNGLCRFNSKDQFNVPFGRYNVINYKTDFREYGKVFKNWKFTFGDFEDVLYTKNDFIYVDPPYDVEFTQYAKENFKWNDQVRLAEFFANNKGPVVLSNQATERIIELYKGLGFRLIFVDAPRMISRDGNRTPAREVIALKGI